MPPPPPPAWLLAPRLDTLPLILAGPILRRVTGESVSVWLALRQAADVSLAVHLGDDPRVGALIMSEPARRTTKLGPHLHLIVITARGGLAADTTYSYDLQFDVVGGPQNLSLREAMSSSAGQAASISYTAAGWPTFSLPPTDIEHLRIVCTSCRMPHAEGDDALAFVDQMILLTATLPTERPHQLLMTGDQIYADDVSDCLLLMISDVGRTLIGDENVPAKAGGNLDVDQLVPTTRTQRVTEGGFTSVDTRSHLLTFGEYVAMYLIVWSDVLWPATLPTYDDLIRAIKDMDSPAGFQSAAEARKRNIERDNTNVHAMRAEIGKVRRLLANVPVYMLFDDHEITDDWNLNRKFCQDVYGNPQGRRIVQNGLLAYALCQHWGNVPEQFAPGTAGGRLLTVLSSGLYETVAARPQIAMCLGIPEDTLLHDPDSLTLQHLTGSSVPLHNIDVDTVSLRYDYTIESPIHQIVVTDSRTWRVFGSGPLSPGQQISAAQLVRQIVQTPPLAGRALLVVITTNMPPTPAIRQGRRDLPGIDRKYALEDFYEQWDEESPAYARLLAALSRKFPAAGGVSHQGGVVVISGDVHTSQAVRITYFAESSQFEDQAGGYTTARVAVGQLVCSSAKKQTGPTVGQHRSGYEYVPDDWLAHALKQSVKLTEGFVGWNSNIIADGAVLGTIFLHDPILAHGDYPLRYSRFSPNKTLREESLPFRTPVGTKKLWTKRVTRLNVRGHYRFRFDYLPAVAAGPYVPQPIAATPSGSPQEALADYSRALQSLLNAAKGGGRHIVGINNVGEVRFAHDDATGKRIVQFLVTWYEGGPMWARYVVSLKPDDAGYPPEYHPTEPP